MLYPTHHSSLQARLPPYPDTSGPPVGQCRTPPATPEFPSSRGNRENKEHISHNTNPPHLTATPRPAPHITPKRGPVPRSATATSTRPQTKRHASSVTPTPPALSPGGPPPRPTLPLKQVFWSDGWPTCQPHASPARDGWRASPGGRGGGCGR